MEDTNGDKSWKQVEKVVGKENVFMTEDEIVSQVVSDYDYNVIITSDECLRN